MKSIVRSVAVGAATALLLIFAAAPASGACPPGTVNQGNSEVDQYQETIPGSCGNQTPGGESDGGNLPADTVDDLNSLGDDGVATAGLAAATAPPVEGNGGSGKGGSGPDEATGGLSVAQAASPADDGSPLAAVAKALGGDSSDGGLGLFLPLLLGGTLIVFLVGLASGKPSV